VIKLICSAKNISFEVVDVDFQNMKVDRAAYPFGQCPRMVDGDVDITQSNAMIR
jgi:glutathione S-transferase